MNKKILMFCFFGLFLINFASAFEFDNFKAYNLQEKEVTIKNCDLWIGTCLIDGEDIGTAKLNTPLDYKVAPGYQKVAEFEITSEGDYKDFLKNMNFYDKNKKDWRENKITRDYDLKYLTYETKIVDDYETSCTLGKEVCNQTTNGTICEQPKSDCKQIKIGTKEIQEEVWNDFSVKDLKGKERKIVGVFTDVQVGDHVEWIPYLFGVEVDEWATWEASLNVGLVSYFSLEESVGSVVVDSFGIHNGTYEGDLPTQIVGKVNYGQDFDGTGDRITIPDHVDYESFTDMGISVWIKPSQTINAGYPTGWQTVLGKYPDWVLQVIENDGAIRLESTGGTYGGEILRTTRTTWTAGTWYHIVFVANSTGTYFYVNGERDNSNSNTGTMGSSANDCYIGGYMDAVIDEVGLWDRDLTGGEIALLYNSGDGLAYGSLEDSTPTITFNSPPEENFTSTPQTLIINLTAYDDINLQDVKLYVNGALNQTNATGINNSNYIFSVTLGEGTWEIYGKATDNASQETITETRTYVIHSTAPSVDVLAPIETIDYYILGENLTLSWNILEPGENLTTHIVNCTYTYNNSLTELNNSLCIEINQTNFTYVLGEDYLIFNVTDEFGLSNVTNVSWEYQVLQNSLTYTTPTYVKTSNQFLVNITSENVSSMILNYGGVNYSANSYISNGNVIGSTSATQSSVTEDTNITFYWIFIMAGGEGIYGREYNQTINFLDVGNTYEYPLYNITVRDEKTNNIISNQNVTISYDVDFGFSSDVIIDNVEFNDNGYENKNISSNQNETLFLEGGLLYSANDFIGRSYYFLEQSIGSKKDITLYLANSSDAYVKTLQVTDEAGRGVEAIFRQYRNVGGENVVVSSEKLGASGETTISFEVNSQYTFEFEAESCENLSNTIIFYDQSDYVQQLDCLSYDPEDYEDPFEDLLTSFSPSGIFQVTNETESDDSSFGASVEGSSEFCSNIDIVTFTVYDDNITTIGTDNDNGCNDLSVSGYFEEFAKGSLYILLDDGSEKTINYRWQKYEIGVNYANYSAIELIREIGNSDDILGIDWKFKLFISLVGLFGVLISMALIQRKYNFSNMYNLIIADVYIWVVCFIGWADVNFGSTQGGFTSLISQYGLFILAIIATIGIIITKEDEYS